MRHASDIELSCFGSILRAFEADPVLGGKSGTGHGKVQLQYEPGWPDAGPYYEFLETNREEIRNYVRNIRGVLK